MFFQNGQKLSASNSLSEVRSRTITKLYKLWYVRVCLGSQIKTALYFKKYVLPKTKGVVVVFEGDY